MTKNKYAIIIISVITNGEVAQLARAFGSYPKGHVFESHLRYQGKSVERLIFFVVSDLKIIVYIKIDYIFIIYSHLYIMYSQYCLF